MTLDEIVRAAVGPVGAIVVLVIATYVLLRVGRELWREHLRADADDRLQRDKAFTIAEAQVAATNRVADTYAELGKDVIAMAEEITAIGKAIAAIRRDSRKP